MNTQNKLVDTRDRITPAAFVPDESLLNLPLARPWRRCGAMLCDLMVVATLTSLNDGFLVALLATTWIFYKIKNTQLFKVLVERVTWLKRILALVVTILIIVMISKSFLNGDNTNTSNFNSFATIAKVTSSAYAGHQCDTVDCWKPHLTEFINNTAELTSEFSKEEILDDVFEGSSLTDEEKTILKEWAIAQPQWNISRKQEITSEPQENKKLANKGVSPSTTSPMQWVFGIIEDLGLGFGFAAIYFTCFTAWFNGQTLGKMLFNTRVIQLNNEPLGLWSSFGRYGGYGAGVATGLLGFIQVYWDANRQTIQDQISATVVIDLTLAKKEELLKHALTDASLIINKQEILPKNTLINGIGEQE